MYILETIILSAIFTIIVWFLYKKNVKLATKIKKGDTVKFNGRVAKVVNVNNDIIDIEMSVSRYALSKVKKCKLKK